MDTSDGFQGNPGDDGYGGLDFACLLDGDLGGQPQNDPMGIPQSNPPPDDYGTSYGTGNFFHTFFENLKNKI